jgi:hypothetical protein
VVYSLFLYHQKNLGGPGSSRGTLERIRAGLTVSTSQCLSWVACSSSPWAASVSPSQCPSWVACNSPWAASVSPSRCPSQLLGSLAATSGCLAASSCWAPPSMCHRHRRLSSTSWSRPRSPQTNAAILPPSPDGLASIHSGRPPVSVPAASPPDHIQGAFGGGHPSLSAAACFSPLALNVTGTSHVTVVSAFRATVPPASHSC